MLSLLLLAVVCSAVQADDIQELKQHIQRIEGELETLKLQKETRANDDFPAFTVVRRDTNYDIAANEKVPYNVILTNKGNAYSTATNEFTAPQAGFYVFTFTVGTPNGNSCFLLLHKNDASEGIVEALGSQADYTRQGSNSVVLELVAGDRISIKASGSCTVQGTPRKFTSFSGYQII